MKRSNLLIAGVFLLISLGFASCTSGRGSELPVSTATSSAELLLTETPNLDSETPASNLTICLGDEPNTLFSIAAPNTAANIILGAVNDGPIDVFSTGNQPVVLEKLPSYQNEDIQVIALEVKKGMKVVDATGSLVSLDIGRTIYPSGCRDKACEITYDGRSGLEMDQMLITYRILPGVEWSDGTALTSDDFLYAFDLAKEPSSQGMDYSIERTYSFEALDDHSLQWWGIPGYLVDQPSKVLPQPLPKHQLSAYSFQELKEKLGHELMPFSYGPYILKEWSKGNYIHLIKNQNYFRVDERLPFFEEVNFLLVDSPQQAVSALITNKCDLLASNAGADAEMGLLMELQKQGQAQVITSVTPLMETLDLRVGPPGVELAANAIKEPFKDQEVRMAIGYCLDRQNIIDTLLNGQSEVPDSYVPPFYPNYSDGVKQYSFDALKGNALLEGVGWVDDDLKKTSTRVAKGIDGLVDGTPLRLKYATTDSPQRRQISQLVAQSLAQCGISVEIQILPFEKFFTQNTQGTLFGGNFDLAQYSTGSYENTEPCQRLTTAQIPSSKNNWFGANPSGYSNPDFDDLCAQAINDAGQSEVSQMTSASAQQIFANELPSLPLFLRTKVIAARSGLCHISLDPGSQNDLWNIENFKVGTDCTQ